ncbi:DUF3817 domain-containing protein [Streptomyces sp. NPDC001922]|uniref:DUF3817 domain-containing protein n=1 Tax=Streptomyces sp. NPDC001922 TaxID=3364624 RepID=UPI00368617B8
MRTLRLAAAVEAASFVALLGNLCTAHIPTITTLVGPLHGTAYLAVIAATALTATAPTSARWQSAVPGVGGLLALRLIGRRTPQRT